MYEPSAPEGAASAANSKLAAVGSCPNPASSTSTSLCGEVCVCVCVCVSVCVCGECALGRACTGELTGASGVLTGTRGAWFVLSNVYIAPDSPPLCPPPHSSLCPGLRADMGVMGLRTTGTRAVRFVLWFVDSCEFVPGV